ncbi:MAG: NUDIX hydrolase [Bacteriovorax sp.]|nr:NUDIX hydrolase [Bacteriovorax sp.]
MTTTLKQKIQIVTIAQNQLLLLQFAKIHNEGFQNITGSVEYDETFMEAARRELLEEISVASPVIDIHHEFHFHDRWGDDVEEKVFLCLLNKIPIITLSEEHQSFKWIPIENVTPADFVFPTNFEAFQKALEFTKK